MVERALLWCYCALLLYLLSVQAFLKTLGDQAIDVYRACLAVAVRTKDSLSIDCRMGDGVKGRGGEV